MVMRDGLVLMGVAVLALALRHLAPRRPRLAVPAYLLALAGLWAAWGWAWSRSQADDLSLGLWLVVGGAFLDADTVFGGMGSAEAGPDPDLWGTLALGAWGGAVLLLVVLVWQDALAAQRHWLALLLLPLLWRWGLRAWRFGRQARGA